VGTKTNKPNGVISKLIQLLRNKVSTKATVVLIGSQVSSCS